MSQTAESIDLTQFDVRPIPCRQKHKMIFERWDALPVGAHFVLVNDHDPVPLYYQFAVQFPGQFTWEYLVTGPDEFHVKISRVAAAPNAAPLVPPPAAAPAAPVNTTELDLRGLEPPEPMMRILTAVVQLSPGAKLQARTDRRPINLYPELDTRGVCYESEEQPDGSWITRIARA